jgi:hypothetical protein
MQLSRVLFGVVLGSAGFLLAVPGLAVPRFVAPGGTDAASSCVDAASPCATIQHAVDVALPGDSIEISPGVYNQRIRIDGKTDLTFEAEGVTLRPDPAVLGPSDVAQGSPCSGGRGRAVVFVNDSSGIVFNGLGVDGGAALPPSNEPDRLAGIFFRDSSGAINGGFVAHLRTEPASSNQVAGLGIIVQTEDPAVFPPPRVDITDVTIFDYQKTGIVFSGCGCAGDGGPTGSVRGSTVTSETSALVARNGIQVSFGAGSVVLEGNVVSGMRFTGNAALGLGSAVILASSRSNRLTGNTLSNSNFGISNIGDITCAPRAEENVGSDFQCNRILGNDWGMSIDNATHGIRNNEFAGNTTFAILTRTYFPAGTDADASRNWWGSPTGPTIASNPGGTGDRLDDRVTFSPFLTARPTCAVEIPTASDLGLALLALLLASAALLRLRQL